jgi:hypothetical protein
VRWIPGHAGARASRERRHRAPPLRERDSERRGERRLDHDVRVETLDVGVDDPVRLAAHLREQRRELERILAGEDRAPLHRRQGTRAPEDSLADRLPVGHPRSLRSTNCRMPP